MEMPPTSTSNVVLTFSHIPATGCQLPSDATNLLRVVSGPPDVFLPGDSVEYDCPDGYQLDGSATQFCRSDLTWSGQIPGCRDPLRAHGK